MHAAACTPEITPQSVYDAVTKRIGPANGATVRELATEILGRPSTAGDERQLREAIVQLRMEGHAICATPGEGYHRAADAQDLQRTCIHLAKRSATGFRQVAAMNGKAMPDFYGQLGLPAVNDDGEEQDRG